MTDQLSALPLAADIRISILSDHEWRICDRRVPDTNAESVLGYIEKTGAYFEVMKLSSPRNLFYFTDLEHAVECFSTDGPPVTLSRRL
ncbi:hypothetical protein B7R22_05805 [Subtercola boreus]|uniref:Uncharacterized protein n=1 Tax=Subtercola boreus TaxID=120213 RepID=A0A3E0W2A2_9MICO|nr:hypothetical protein [Subtercola boreus]RFA15909.1 hypothetical protein B7R22_05805 [Subtercola boreus]